MKKVNARKLMWRMLFPIMAVLIIEVGVAFLLFFGRGYVRESNDNALQILEEKARNRQNNIQNEMTLRWDEFDETQYQIDNEIRGFLKKRDMKFEELSDGDIKRELLAELMDPMVFLLRKNLTNGAFFILNSSGDHSGEYRGIYLRDSTPSMSYLSNSDLSILRGLNYMTSDGRKMPLDAEWKPFFRFRGNYSSLDEILPEERFFFTPLMVAEQFPEVDTRFLGYWSADLELPTGEKVLTYSVPIRGESGEIYGVIGVEVHPSQLRRFLSPGTAAEVQKNNSFFMATRDVSADSAYQIRFSDGKLYPGEKVEKERLTPTGKHKEHLECFELDGGKEGRVYAVILPLRLYHNNSPYASTEWVIMGMESQTSIKKFGKAIFDVFLATVGFLVLTTVFAVLSVSVRISKNLNRVVQDIKDSDTHEVISIDRTDIKEFNFLLDAIEGLSKRVYESASQIAGIVKMSSAEVGIFEYHLPTRTYYGNGSFAALVGITAMNDRFECTEKVFLSHLERMDYEEIRRTEDHTIYRINENGESKWLKIHMNRTGDKLLGVAINVTDEYLRQAELERKAFFDSLTGLYNRDSFEKAVKEKLSSGKVRLAALIMWDMDNLKYVNDTYGHRSGDLLLKRFAEELAELSPGDALHGRRSGDEFYTFLVSTVESEQEKNQMTRDIYAMKDVLKNKYVEMENGEQLRIRVSGGVSWYPNDSEIFEDLSKYSDYALYGVKHRNKGALWSFDREAYETDQLLFTGTETLNRILDEELVKFVFQPIVHIADGVLYGYELLIRPLLAPITSSGELLRLATKQAKLAQVERLTMMKGMKTYVRHIEEGKIAEDCRVFINTLGSQILTPRDLSLFERDYGKYLKNIVLEITEEERLNMEIFDEKRRWLEQWSADFAIDDYGTGYNSEKNLMLFHPNLVKIDMSFIRDVDKDPNKQTFLRNIVSYLKSNQILSLAEGVETEEEFLFLKKLDVDYVQGFYIGRPEDEPTLNEDFREKYMKK